jgi:mRNA interferase RelE/StbE
VNVRFRESFVRDLRGVKDKTVADRVKQLIEDVERSKTLSEVPHLKKLKGGSSFFRIRVGDYRTGVSIEGDTMTFVRFLHRKEVYRYFP